VVLCSKFHGLKSVGCIEVSQEMVEGKQHATYALSYVCVRVVCVYFFFLLLFCHCLLLPSSSAHLVAPRQVHQSLPVAWVEFSCGQKGF
jgi:hypothetical protein